MTTTVETTVTTEATVVAKAPRAMKTTKSVKAFVPSHRFTFNGKGWMASIKEGSGIALKPANREKLVAHAISLKVGAPSDLKKLKQETLLAKVAKAVAA